MEAYALLGTPRYLGSVHDMAQRPKRLSSKGNKLSVNLKGLQVPRSRLPSAMYKNFAQIINQQIAGKSYLERLLLFLFRIIPTVYTVNKPRKALESKSILALFAFH